MGNLPNPKNCFLFAFHFLILTQIQVLCYQQTFKVGDLDAWGTPTSSNPQLYVKWSKFHSFNIGDSLLFLYPPSQESVIQVTQESYEACNIKDPILYMNNGNSLFNITSNGTFYFTSGIQGHCEKKQKLQISVGYGNGSSASSPDSLPAISPSYPNVFGTIPARPSSAVSLSFRVILAAFGFTIFALFNAKI